MEEKKSDGRGSGFIPPNPKYCLRVLCGYLWDTEALVDGQNHLGFFERPMGQKMEWIDVEKTGRDTNMPMPRQIQKPHQFSIVGVHISVSPMDARRRDELLFDGRLSFRFVGDRLFFESMLSDMVVPEKSKIQWDDAVKRYIEKEPKPGEEYNVVDDPISSKKEKEPLYVGKNALLIMPGEAFHWAIDWSKPQKLVDPVMFRVAMYGLRWVPM